ncbi:unannotated protein [freshwater metagenome]|uniref:Unannotated protein n=1 Tax=freshwater metagenome TaxID=449393 RepID=A0A6J7IHK8_9ZZZZ
MGDKTAQCVIEPLCLTAYELGRAIRGINCAIKDYSSNVIGKEVGIDGTESCPVGESHEVQSAFTQSGS